MLRSITFLAAILLVLFLTWGLMTQPPVSDWTDFWPNLAVEFLSSLIFGVIVLAVLDFQRRSFEASQVERISRDAKRRYLTNIKKEIQDNTIPLLASYAEQLGEAIERGKSADEFWEGKIDRWDTEISLEAWRKIRQLIESASQPIGAMPPKLLAKTTYWDALIPSGVLTSLLSEDLLGEIADYYQLLRRWNYCENNTGLFHILMDFEPILREGSYRRDAYSSPTASYHFTHWIRLRNPIEAMIIADGVKLIEKLEDEIGKLVELRRGTNANISKWSREKPVPNEEMLANVRSRSGDDVPKSSTVNRLRSEMDPD